MANIKKYHANLKDFKVVTITLRRMLCCLHRLKELNLLNLIHSAAHLVLGFDFSIREVLIPWN
jgi:hypothetical protein